MIEWKKNLSPTTTSKGTQNDNMYQLLGGARNNNDSEDDSALEENLLKLKNYTYFDGDKILASLKLSAKDKKIQKIFAWYETTSWSSRSNHGAPRFNNFR